MRFITEMINPRMAVVDLEKLLLNHFSQLLCGEREMKIRVVQVRNNGLPEALRLLSNHSEVVPHGIDHGSPLLWWN